MQKKVAILMVWLGNLPEFHKMWCESIKYNPNFDWFLITNDKNEENINYIKNIKNIHFIYLKQNELYTLIKNKCEVNVEANFYPYKLCDFRPMFGRIFDHLLKDYDYWGWTDNDVIYGNLEKVLSEKFNKFDVIGTGTSNRCSGPLCFFKNIDEINNLYKKLDKNLFRGKHKGVDEGKFSHLVKDVLGGKKRLDLSFKAHPLRDSILWYKGHFFNKEKKMLNHTHFHFGGGKRKRLQKNVKESVINMNFPCDGVKFNHILKVSYHNQN